MKYRKMRIAWSVAWSMVAVLLIVLWVRTNSPWTYYYSRFQTHMNGGFGIRSFDGRLGIYSWDMRPARWNSVAKNWRSNYGRTDSEPDGILGFAISRSWAYGVILPYWFLTILTVFIVASSWLHWRFSLRTLLIATTLIAVGLGLIVWLR
jgi:hypothetical protein